MERGARAPPRPPRRGGGGQRRRRPPRSGRSGTRRRGGERRRVGETARGGRDPLAARGLRPGKRLVDQHHRDVRHDRIHEVGLPRVETLRDDRLLVTKLLPVFFDERLARRFLQLHELQRALGLRANQNRQKLGVDGHVGNSFADGVYRDKTSPMRILHIVAGEKWTGIAAVVHDWTRALVEAGVEEQFAFAGGHNLEKRVLPAGWARPLLSPPHGVAGTLWDLPALSRTLDREPVDVLHVHTSHDHYLAALARRRRAPRPLLLRTIHHVRHTKPDRLMRRLFRSTDAFAFANRDIARAFGREGPVHSPVVDTGVFCPGARPALLPSIGALPIGRRLLGTVA